MPNTSNSKPQYVATCELIAKFARAKGIRLAPQPTTIDGQPGNQGWACFQNEATMQKIYVPRSVGAPGTLHTSLSVPRGTPGWVDHMKGDKDRRPGKIESFFSADPDTLENLLNIWAGTTEPLRPARRGATQDAPEAVAPGATTAEMPTQDA